MNSPLKDIWRISLLSYIHSISIVYALAKERDNAKFSSVYWSILLERFIVNFTQLQNPKFRNKTHYL